MNRFQIFEYLPVDVVSRIGLDLYEYQCRLAFALELDLE